MFTVVIPLFNKELSIKDTIDSVLKQTYQNFEIIVINDGSTDSSTKIVESIDDDRVRVIHQKNQGVSAARNRGIKEASYEWIAFLDGDDLWEINHLKEIHKMMVTFPNEKVYVTSFKFSNNKKLFKHPRLANIFKIENYFKEAIKEYLIWTSVVVVHRSCFDKIGGFDISLTNGEDLALWAKLASSFVIIKSCKITATYRVEAENRTNLNRQIEKTHVFHFKLNTVLNDDERKYYEYLILSRLYSYCRVMDLKNVFKLKNRHPEVSWSDFLSFSIKTMDKSFKRKFHNIKMKLS